MKLRLAVQSEAEILSKITLEAKKYWGYSEELIELWMDDLTITREYIENNVVFVCESESNILGYFSLTTENYSSDDSNEKNQCTFLDNLFVDPAYIGKGIGKKLVLSALEWCEKNGIKKLYVVSDPNAKGFYENVGFTYLSERETSIQNRTLPLLVYTIVQSEDETIYLQSSEANKQHLDESVDQLKQRKYKTSTLEDIQ